MIYGYARVSTKGQAKDGNSLEAQRTALLDNGATEIFSDSFTGTKKDRPELNKLLGKIQSGDTLIVTKLDRVARSASQGAELIDGLLKRGVAVHVLNMGLMNDTPTGKLIRTIMFAFAEFERDMIVERTQEGKEIARQREDYREGRQRVEVPEFDKFYQQVQAGFMSVVDACKELGISRSKWYRLANN